MPTNTSTPVKIAISGAAGQISYSLLFRLASGDFLGKDQPIELSLLEIPQAMDALQGTVMEIEDCAFPLISRVLTSSDPEQAFDNIDYAFLVGARPRGAGMERKDLLEANAEIFSVQGKALDNSAKKSVRVVVVGNPANTNALIAQSNATSLDPSQFTAMTRLDHNRAVAKLAAQTNSHNTDIDKAIIWGNHSATQYPDLHCATVSGTPAMSLIDQNWYENKFIPEVQQRGAAVIKARGLSSAASAANAAVDHMRDWLKGSKWTSMAVRSSNPYGISEDIFFSYPVSCGQGKWQIINISQIANDLAINDFSLSRIGNSEKELLEERQAIKHLLA